MAVFVATLVSLGGGRKSHLKSRKKHKEDVWKSQQVDAAEGKKGEKKTKREAREDFFKTRDSFF